MNDKIDFVVLWVDGADPAWLAEKARYEPKRSDFSTKASRFRDWDNLRYWFRGVEKFAPWVNRVFFVTWGHLPPWLDTGNPKLQIVTHREFIPEQYLPTYNSDTIETNLFRLEDLSEQFVLFNDDMFLIDAVQPEDFFSGGLPRDTFVENLIAPVGNFGITHTKVVMTDIINAHFKKRQVHRKLFTKVYNFKYGKQNLITLYFEPFGYFTGFRNPHIAQPHLKSTFAKVWELEEEKLNTSCMNRFRGTNDVSHWVMRYWNLCSGQFVPHSIKFGRYFVASDHNQAVCSCIRGQKCKTICVNDVSKPYDFEKARLEINASFESILGQPSSFEKR